MSCRNNKQFTIYTTEKLIKFLGEQKTSPSPRTKDFVKKGLKEGDGGCL